MNNIEQRILEIVAANEEKLQAIGDDIYCHAERGYAEFRTAKIVADFLKDLGLEVREGIAVTGVKATIKGEGGEGPNVALIGELDGIGCAAHPYATPEGFSHACGHYAQILSILGAALVLTDPEIKKQICGSVTIFAVPAEEFLDAAYRKELLEKYDIQYNGGKAELIRRGEFDDIDLSVTNHSLMSGREAGIDLMLGNSAATGFVGKTVIMHGKAAHAAAAPHEGVNALNATTLALSAIGLLRETFREKDYVRIHPYIPVGGNSINVVPSEVISDMMVRAANLDAIEDASRKVDNAYKGAALAIGAEAEIINAQGYMPVYETLPMDVQWEAAKPLMEKGVRTESITPGLQNTASTDVGDLQAIMPVVNYTFGGSIGALHSKDFEVTDRYIANIMPAQYMALLTYHLMKDGAAEAKKIVADYKPLFTKETYIEQIEKSR